MQKTQPNSSPSRAWKLCSTPLSNDGGFGLIEVVVAMALIAGAYIGMVEAYQRMRLHYGQIEAQRTELNRAQDQHERDAL
jgi:prepilin-type N-terminal cleavage/methylation domain-containing protein